jgi:hypothetical protein
VKDLNLLDEGHNHLKSSIKIDLTKKIIFPSSSEALLDSGNTESGSSAYPERYSGN